MNNFRKLLLPSSVEYIDLELLKHLLKLHDLRLVVDLESLKRPKVVIILTFLFFLA